MIERTTAGQLYILLLVLPAFEEIPDTDQLNQLTSADAFRWVISHTAGSSPH